MKKTRESETAMENDSDRERQSYSDRDIDTEEGRKCFI